MMRISRLIRSQRVTYGPPMQGNEVCARVTILVSLIALVVTGAAGATGSATDFAAARAGCRHRGALHRAGRHGARCRPGCRTCRRPDRTGSCDHSGGLGAPQSGGRWRVCAAPPACACSKTARSPPRAICSTLLSPVTSPVVMLASSLQTPTDGQGHAAPVALVSDQLPDAGRRRHPAAGRHHRQRRDDRGARLGALAGSEPELCVALARDHRCAQWRLRPGPRRSLRSRHARHVDRRGRRDEYFRQLLEHRAAGKSGGRARLRRHGRRPLRRCDRRSQLDRRESEEVQHPRPQSIIWRAHRSRTTGTIRWLKP